LYGSIGEHFKFGGNSVADLLVSTLV
jgi:hypothetical protein